MISVYGLLIGLGILAAYQASLWAAKKRKIDKKFVEDVLFWAVLPGIVGARIYHVIDLWGFYRLELVKVLYLWEGGLGIWGAVVGGLLGLIGYYLVKLRAYNSLGLLGWLDVGIIGLPLAQAIGRWGNLANGELWGVATTLPWGIVADGVEGRVHPLFLYESLLNLALFGGLVWLVKRRVKRGAILGSYLIGYGVIRFLLEPLRPEEIVWTVLGIPVAQIMAVVAIIAGSGLLLKKTRRG